jgi:16S rRNA G966 N2-methylase RsmD
LINLILSPKIQSIIERHKLDNPIQHLLKYKNIFGVPAATVVDQIVGRRKAKVKLPSWFQNTQVIYPPAVNIEQSSSEKTAQYKVKILTNEFGYAYLLRSSILDLTGGFGVDSFYFSRIFREVHFVEPNNILLEIAQHNHRQLGANNLYYYNTSAEEYLKSSSQIDFIYIDPSRRPKGNQKVFSLNQSEPAVVLLQKKIWQVSNNLLVKVAPLLDIHQGLTVLNYAKKIAVISIENECKELLFLCQKNFDSTPTIEATDISDEDRSISFQLTDERDAKVNYSEPLEYLYEPNASILKSGAFKTIATIFNIQKLHPNTHLYTSTQLIENFPGRIFQIESFVKAHPRALKKNFPNGKANIATRNYPLSVDELRKKTGLKDGGDKFLIGLSGIKKKFLVAAKKIN